MPDVCREELEVVHSSDLTDDDDALSTVPDEEGKSTLTLGSLFRE